MSVDDVAGSLALTLALQQLADALRENEQLHVAMDQLHVALEHRTVIGQAQGILMARLGIDADAALAYLKRVSSHTNTKLIYIAAEVTRTLELPGTGV